MAANPVTNLAAALGNNGGPTQTFALLAGSNAIDAVPSGACVYVSSGSNPLFTNGATYLKNGLVTGYADNTFTYGIAGDVPVAGHWQLIYSPVPNPGSVLVPPTAVPAVRTGVGD